MDAGDRSYRHSDRCVPSSSTFRSTPNVTAQTCELPSFCVHVCSLPQACSITAVNIAARRVIACVPSASREETLLRDALTASGGSCRLSRRLSLNLASRRSRGSDARRCGWAIPPSLLRMPTSASFIFIRLCACPLLLLTRYSDARLKFSSIEIQLASLRCKH